MGGVCGKSGEEQNCLHGLVRKYEEKTAFAKGRHKWENNIEMDLNHVEREDIDRIHLTEERDNEWALKKTVMNSHLA